MMKRLILIAVILFLTAGVARADWPEYPIDFDTFAGDGSIAWTVDMNAYQSSISYKVLTDDTCVVTIALIGTSVTGSGRELRILLPEGIVPAKLAYNDGVAFGLSATDETHVSLRVMPEIRQIFIGPWKGTISNPQSPVSIFGEITFPIERVPIKRRN